jgi:hypothetical protein
LYDKCSVEQLRGPLNAAYERLVEKKEAVSGGGNALTKALSAAAFKLLQDKGAKPLSELLGAGLATRLCAAAYRCLGR